MRPSGRSSWVTRLNFREMHGQSRPGRAAFRGISESGKALLTEAEKAYHRGRFDTAMAKYIAAAEADPHLYEAPLYAGDTAYVERDLPTAAKWFAKAIAIDPNRETAYRYWGDAISNLATTRLRRGRIHRCHCGRAL